ncbi:MAG TPA: cysteine desulfurase-like protein [Dongiaceae bacterium]
MPNASWPKASWNVDRIRAEFPALDITDDNRRRLFFDAPGGTQVPKQVVKRMTDYLIRSNANSGGPFVTSRESDAISEEAHRAMADLLNAPAPEEIIFGANMTTLTFAMTRSLARRFKAGDEIILTRMDHDGNVAPWLLLARDLGLTVKWLDFDPLTFEYRLDTLASLVTPRTRLAAVNYASNALGTINDVKAIAAAVHAVGGLVYVDAVQYVPHGPTDVQDIGCDFLACSSYKFFGPHQGILWGRRVLLEELDAYKVRPASNELPTKFETGTQNFEAQAGCLGAVEYLEWLGQSMGGGHAGKFTSMSGRRHHVHAAMAAMVDYEIELAGHLLDRLGRMAGLRIHGITARDKLHKRVPTFSVTIDGRNPADVCRRLAAENIFTWEGDFYAQEVVGRLGLADKGGLLRIGLCHYNTRAEVDRLCDALGTA